ncbi:MAG: TIGR01620 family protein [Gemmobacter sp.]|uniref:TIGR01620 family protein n=1 Tax=Gemmobacter sp. TaxID=1898957 RepID=UPI003919A57D
MTDPARPFIVELDRPAPDPAAAPPVPEPEAAPTPAMLRAMAPGRRGRAGAVLAWAAGAFLSLAMGIAAYDFVAGLIARWPLLGWLALALAGVALVALVWLAAREWAALMRLGRVDGIRTRAQEARSPDAARRVLAELDRLYAGRPEMEQPRALLAAKAPDLLDADALIRLAERELLAAPDQAARREIEAAARRVATATALVPLALVDVAVALAANLAMIRRVAEIYGGRAGTFGSWRLLRRVFGHLVATGAVAVGDDLISSVAGGGVVSRLSRRFGEGVVNAALTARVGIAAVEVCRPLPFDALERPGTTTLVGRALAGFFGSGREH